MPGKRKRGAGWEDEMVAARQRADTAEEDKRVADAIRTAAAADAKKRTGGGVRRKRCKTCGSLPKKGSIFPKSEDGYYEPNFAAVQPPGNSKWVYDKDSKGQVIGRHAEPRTGGKLGFKIGTWEI